MAHPKQLFKANGKVFFPLAGQPGTNVSFLPGELDVFFAGAKQMRLNAAEIQLYWRQINPEPGVYDFGDVDRVLAECRAHGMKWLLTWFGTWKNGTMKYVPNWVKKDKATFQRVVDCQGTAQNVLSSHCQANYEADRDAFVALMHHLKQVDADDQTVIGIQVENESGIFGRTPRDYGPEAEREYQADVPDYLMNFIARRGEGHEYEMWTANGQKRRGSWREVFGRDGAELLTAWSVASYINGIARAGKDVYPLPMYANNWRAELRFRYPGVDYPVGGPNSKALNLWRAVCEHTGGIDMLCPDIYVQDYVGFNHQCSLYDRDDNPLFIPETGGRTHTAWQPFAAVGLHDSIGYATMGGVGNAVDESGRLRPEYQCIAASFRGLADVAPLLIKHYATGDIHGIVQVPDADHDYIELDGYNAYVQYGGSSRHLRGTPVPPEARGAGLLIQAGPHEFYIVGYGFSVELHKACPPTEVWPDYAQDVRTQEIDYLLTEEGYFDDDGQWHTVRYREGDTNDYGIAMHSLDTRCLHVLMNG